jgi:hypothetical protein
MDVLQRPTLFHFLTRIDEDTVAVAHGQRCAHCGGRLDRGDYSRKADGVPDWVETLWSKRFSLCCSRDGCRRRLTPPSVRFLGRRVYAGVVVVLVSAMVHGVRPEAVRKLREAVGVDRRTLERWRQWWTEAFVQTSLWVQLRGMLMPPVDEGRLPGSLLERLGQTVSGVVELMRLLGPVTTGSAQGVLVQALRGA